MFPILWILTLFVFHPATTSGYIETVVVSGCSSCRLMLTCRHLTSVIAILEVDYKFANGKIVDNATMANNTIIVPTPFPPVNPREALNQRCSGVNHCSFILTDDCPGAEEWTASNITIKYACISEDKIKKYCNSEIVLPSADHTKGVSQGFIHNPGYPRFYSGQLKCRWKITAPYQQKIQLAILDISLIVDNVLGPNDCTDTLEIKDLSGQVLHSTCRQETPPLRIVSSSETVEVVLTSTQNINPRRGVLIHYTAVGCPTPDTPEDGYLVYRNDMVAEFSCCVGFRFPDTRLRTKMLTCLGSFWNTTLPLLNCEKISYSASDEIKYIKKLAMGSDLIAPTFLILALFLINAGVLFVIYKAKKRQADVIKEEELRTLPTRHT